jgi:hypothetical protein
MKSLKISCLIIIIFSAAGLSPAKGDFASSLFSRVDEFLVLRDKLPKAKDSRLSWLPFTDESRKDIQSDINACLDGTLDILLDGSAVTIKREILALEAKNRSIQDRISRLEMEKISAPSDKKSYQFWTSTKENLDQKILDSRLEIRENSRLIDQKREEIRSYLAQSNINLTEEQMKMLLITVSGQDQLDALVALKNIYSLTETLKGLLQSSSNLTISKKYYGIFLLAAEAHQRQLLLFMDRLDKLYVPKLKELQAENRTLMAETRNLAKTNSLYQSNLAAQSVTEEVTIKYMDLLVRQRSNLEVRLAALNEVLKYADNTYRTISLASSLAASMEEGLNTLQALLEMPIMPPAPFENRLEDTFLELSAKIAGY